ncbi:MAG TPA: AAA family ATPase [Micromonosporaceae bacterium]|nr:AAA family ATPase [Micromonosporaceae bacterium]
MSAGVGEGPFIGRAGQMQAVAAAFGQVDQGETLAVVVTGESGAGKTHFLTAVTRQLVAAGGIVLAGACLDIGQAPLYPLRQALRRFVAEAGRAGTPAASAASDLITLLDGGMARPDVAGSWLERISTGLGAVTRGAPLVLALDDLHWADPTTRDLLKHLLAVPSGMRLLMLGAARAEDLLGVHPVRLLVLEWHRRRLVQVVRLDPLGRAETEQLAEALVGRPLELEEAARIWARSGGNPFVVEGLARGLREGETGLPESLREIAVATVDALPRQARTVVCAVAAGVEPVDHDLLRRVVDLGDEALIAALRAATDQRILEEDPGGEGYRFRLGLYREALAAGFLIGERVALHRRYAQAITEAPGGREQHARLAHHWRQAGERQLALAEAVAAAEEAEERYGFAEGFEHWTLALDVIGKARPDQLGGVERAEVLRRAALAADRSGEHERAVDLLGELAAGLTGPVPCWLHISRAGCLAALGCLAEAEAEYENVLAGECATDRDWAVAAAHSAGLLVRLGRYAAAGQRAREALDVARRVGDTSSVVLASAALGSSQAALDDPVAGRQTVEEALAAAERSGGSGDILQAYLHLADLLTNTLDELETGVAVAREGAARADALGLGRTCGTQLLAVAANGLFRLGRWGEDEQVIAEAFARRPAGTEAADLLLARSRLYLGYGDFDAGERDLDAVTTLVAGGGGARYVLPLLTLRAGLAMWRGDHVAAREAVHDGLEQFVDHSDDVVALATLVWHGLRAEAEATAGGRIAVDDGAVGALRKAEERIAVAGAARAGPVLQTVTGYLALCAGERSRIKGQPDPDAWALAGDLWERSRHPYPAAYARLRQADAGYAVRARNAAADAALRAAYRAARQLDARPLLAEISVLAKHARVTLVRPGERTAAHEQQDRPAGELARLTGRELQVLALVAEGLTNQAVARRLRIRPSTAGVHVTHILDKLQIHSRVQATAIFLRNQRS